jgi:putative pyruvate formate lyase activating enzyme
MYPSYLELERNELEALAERATDMLRCCRLCPRECQVNRAQGETGFCQTGRYAHIASYHLHFGEERPLVGVNGSGTIFFAGCNLGCVFCQNYEISHSTSDSLEVSPAQLAAIMIDLQNKGAHNINLVTPSHVIPHILEALPIAVRQGLTVPIVYNSSGYDNVASLKLLHKIVDIYMPDTKFADPSSATTYCQAKDYPQRAREALREMHSQTGDLEIDSQGIAKRGLVVRHLIMPDKLKETEQWLQFIANDLSLHTYINIMDQYRPCGHAFAFPEINRCIKPEEYRQALHLAQKYGLTRLDQKESRIYRALFHIRRQ